MVDSAEPQVDSAAELGIACLVQAGRWDELGPFMQQYRGSARTAEMELALASAQLRAGQWDEAINGLVSASERHPSSSSLCEFALRVLTARADELIRAHNWQEASTLINQALAIDPKHPAALRKSAELSAAGPREQLQSADRSETAAIWEREFVADRKTETAHHLAILYYWWAAQDSGGDIVRTATLWQRSIGWWVYALYDSDYWSEWIDRKRPSYSVEGEPTAHLRLNVRKQLEARIAGLAESVPGVPQRIIDDLAMDCWAEFEVAEYLREAGVKTAYGPLLMHLLDRPRMDGGEAAQSVDRHARLGDCVLPFISDADALISMCQGGLSRALAYLATGRHDRAMAIAVGRLNTLPQDDPLRTLAGEMCAYIEIVHAEEVYVRLKCPPEEASYDRILEYTREVETVIAGLSDARSQIAASGNQQAMARLVDLIGRRTYNEFSSFSGDAGRRGKVLESGIGLLDRALQLATGSAAADEIGLYLAAMVNRLALHIGSDEHDRVISLLERAVQWAPDNPNYRRNLAFSYFNRYAARKQRDADRLGAREDIKKAHQLAPYDNDIRAEYELMHGSGRA